MRLFSHIISGYRAPILWAIGISAIWCILILFSTNMDAGQTIAGPDGEPYVVKLPRPASLFFAPGCFLARYASISNYDFLFAIGYSLIAWTAVFFSAFLLIRKSVLMKKR